MYTIMTQTNAAVFAMEDAILSATETKGDKVAATSSQC
jgi:hypothetical protein